jgi:hypothetical protein
MFHESGIVHALFHYSTCTLYSNGLIYESQPVSVDVCIAFFMFMNIEVVSTVA